jgi:hypothetical protein
LSWSRPFDRPIKLPSGKIIRTLGDAGRYLDSLSKSRHQDPAFVTALEVVWAAFEGRGPLLHANAGIGQLVHGPRKRPELRPPKARPAIKLLRDQ